MRFVIVALHLVCHQLEDVSDIPNLLGLINNYCGSFAEDGTKARWGIKALQVHLHRDALSSSPLCPWASRRTS